MLEPRLMIHLQSSSDESLVGSTGGGCSVGGCESLGVSAGVCASVCVCVFVCVYLCVSMWC